ncbi:MAG: Xaa-Pro peptidase family protein [Candidatus Aenigmarchaeota archaeon]|nr:Xaa-Pro peptidase family protein [Candidatus Aenigmarchaeota archaeon]
MALADFQGRIKKLRSLMEKNRLDACLINSRNDVYYYTGNDIGDSCFLLISEAKPCIFVTSLSNEIESAKEFNAIFIKGVSDISKRLKRFRRVGFDEYSTSYKVFSDLKKSKPVLKPSASIIKEPRMVKDEWEMEQISKAAGITAKTMSNLGEILGKSETDLSEQIELSFRKAGAKPSFDTIIASGKHSAFIHHKPDKAMIKQDDLVIIDIGAVFNSYCSDMTRTFCKKPGPKERKIIENISGIQGELIDMAKDGIKYDDMQKRYEALLKRKGYKLLHSFGHGIGIGVHERPAKGDTLKSGMVITVEPGTYIKGFGGYRIEDMVIVRKGRSKILTR